MSKSAINRFSIYRLAFSYFWRLPALNNNRHLPWPGVTLFYGLSKKLDKRHIRYIDNDKIPHTLKIIRTIAIIGLIVFFILGYLRINFEQLLNLKVLGFLIIVYIFPAFFSVKKENEDDFKITLSIIKSLPEEQLNKALDSLEESEQMLVKQRFGLKKGDVPLSIYELADINDMDYSDIKKNLISVDNKLFAALETIMSPSVKTQFWNY